MRPTIFTLLLGVAIVLLGAGFLGALHPVGDSLAVFRVYLGLGLAGLAALLLRMQARRRAGMAALAALVGLWPLSGFVAGAGQAGAAGARGYHLYQKNLLFRNPDPGAVGRDILARAPDFVTLQEVSQANQVVLEQLDEAFVARHFCGFSGVGGVAVASRWPKVAGSETCAERDGLAAMQVTTPDGPVWVVALHLNWPWPHPQAAQAQRLAPYFARLTGPKVIGGDFNMVAWSHLVGSIETATGATALGPPHVSLIREHGLLRIPIDQVLVSGGQGRIERLALLGSDHFGLLGRFTLRAH